MHTHDLTQWRRDHQSDNGNVAGERSTLLVLWITAGMMCAQVMREGTPTRGMPGTS